MKYKTEIEKLRQSGTGTPELDLRILLQMATGKTREFFMAYPEYELSTSQRQKFEELMERRLRNEPIAHITGKKEFYGRDFAVGPNVLTPRPETEHIIDAALRYFPAGSKPSILDLGTGSGCILITLLAELPGASGVGADISNNALAIAKANAYNLGVGNLRFICSSWTKEIKDKQFDLIVSNPPYVERGSDKLNLETRFEPEMALFAEDEGLAAYKQIAAELKSFDFKYAIFEFGQGQDEMVKTIFEKNGFKTLEIIPDYAGINRLIVITKEG